jgi:hypothetical protein
LKHLRHFVQAPVQGCRINPEGNFCAPSERFGPNRHSRDRTAHQDGTPVTNNSQLSQEIACATIDSIKLKYLHSDQHIQGICPILRERVFLWVRDKARGHTFAIHSRHLCAQECSQCRQDGFLEVAVDSVWT